MAWVINSVAQATPSATSPITITYSGNTSKLYLLVASRDGAADPYTTVVDSAGNTWTRYTFAPASGTVGRRIEYWFCDPGTPFTSITLSFTGVTSAQATLVEINGYADAFVDQITSGVRAATFAPVAFTITPSMSGSLVVAAIQANNNTDSQITIDAAWTRLSTNTKGPSIAYRTDVVGGSDIGASWTLTNSVGSGHAIVSLVPSAPTVGEPTITVWTGSVEIPAAIEGIWNGSTVVAATIGSVT